MPRCPECEERVAAGEKSCPACGASLRTPPPQGGGKAAKQPRRSARPQKNSSTALVIGLGTAVMIVGVVVVIVLLARSGKDDGAGGGGWRPRAAAESRNNLKQIGLALHTYNDTYRGFPPGGIFDAQGRGQHGWQTMLLPFVEQAPLHGKIDFKLPWDAPGNAAWFKTRVEAYQSPEVSELEDAQGFALSHYAGNSHVLRQNHSLRFRDVTDGASNTLLAGEAAGKFRPWGDPQNVRDPWAGINTGPESFGHPSGGPGQFLLMDGSVRTIDGDISPDVLKALATPNGGERVD
ncbi:MAG: DUF1559 domain-containing protein [Planctomycetes bacterium]|nr:DUF1559 domain-containing protein [Planctomycetota bacterium]